MTPRRSFRLTVSSSLATLNGSANVSLTFKPSDGHGNWQIDDVYVDPYKTK